MTKDMVQNFEAHDVYKTTYWEDIFSYQLLRRHIWQIIKHHKLKPMIPH